MEVKGASLRGIIADTRLSSRSMVAARVYFLLVSKKSDGRVGGSG
jgi:hypothetical protein